MITIYLIYAALAATSLANGPFQCSFLGSDEIHQCIGAVGQPLIFHLSNKTNMDIRLTKDGRHRILKTEENSKVKVEEEYANNSEIMYNGAYKISKTSKRHAGNYLLEEYGSDGQRLKKISVHLKVQVPVSKPVVSQTCLSPEAMEITCSSEGDEAEFILTLDDLLIDKIRKHGQPQIESTAKECGVSTNLRGQLVGQLRCQVQNDVSKDEAAIHLTRCNGLRDVEVAVIANVATLSVFATLSFILIKLCKKSRPTAVSEGGSEGEIIYSDVGIIKNTSKSGRGLASRAR